MKIHLRCNSEQEVATSKKRGRPTKTWTELVNLITYKNFLEWTQQKHKIQVTDPSY